MTGPAPAPREPEVPAASRAGGGQVRRRAGAPAHGGPAAGPAPREHRAARRRAAGGPERGEPDVPALYATEVRHVRTTPQRYRLRHRGYLWLVDLDGLPALPRPMRPLARFDPRDHFDGRGPTVRAGLERYLAAQGAAPPGGKVLMLAHARVLGFVFNPLSVFWCHDRDGVLRHVVAEVHNTYGERHCYLLGPEAAEHAWTPKDFYVSPFLAVAGGYRMRLPVPGERLDLAVHLQAGPQRLLTATVRGTRGGAHPAAVLRAVLRHPAAPLAAAAAIRVHGVRLYLRGLPVVPRPRHRPQEGMQ